MAKKSKKSPTNLVYRRFGNLGLGVETTGYPNLEMITDLEPPTGLSRFYTMQANDPIVGGIMWHVRSILSRCCLRWKGEVPEDIKETLGPDFWGTIMGDLCSTFTYGFYVGEQLWGIKDGLPMLLDIEPRYQPTIYKFLDGAIEQSCTEGTEEIPISKVLHITIGADARSPYGTSLLRSAYQPYYMKTHIEASEANSLDRDLAGLPVITAPEGFDFMRADSESDLYDPNVAATLQVMVDIVQNIRKDTQQGVVLPNGWELRLLRAEGEARDTEGPIRRHNEAICVAMLESFLSSVVSAKGRSTNSEYYLAVLTTAINEHAKRFVREINKQVISRLQAYRGFTGTLEMESLTNYNLKDLASYIGRLVAQEVITPTPRLQEALLGLVDLPYDKEAADAYSGKHDKG